MGMMKVVAPQDQYPVKRLNDDGDCLSMADVETGLGEMAWIDSSVKTGESILENQTQLARAEFLTKVAAAQKSFNERVSVQIGRKRQSIVERRDVLHSGLEAFCSVNRALLLAEERGKTRRFTSGTIAWRESTPMLESLPVKKRPSVAAYLAKLVEGFAESLLRLFERRELFGVKLFRLVRYKLEWRKVEMLQLAKDGEITAEQLKSIGWKYKKPVDELHIEPSSEFVRAESEEVLA